jgi:hypothetical protein
MTMPEEGHARSHQDDSRPARAQRGGDVTAPGDGASQTQSFANRANASHSTGPRTRRGKARVSRNALRHGITALRFADDGGEATRIAGLITDSNNLLVRDQAIIIAECFLLIARIRRARAAALERMALDELSALERYERRALSRRRRAIGALAIYITRSD